MLPNRHTGGIAIFCDRFVLVGEFIGRRVYWQESLLVREFEARAGDIFAFCVLAIGAELDDSVA